MNMSKSFGVIFLAVAGMLLGGSIHAQNPVRDAVLPAEPLPRDIYPDSRSRLPLPEREDMDADDKKILDQLTRESELHDGMEQPRAYSSGLRNSPNCWAKLATTWNMKSDCRTGCSKSRFGGRV